MANQTNSLAHTKWLGKYQIVFTPKYRRKIIYNQYRASIQEIIRHLCRYKGVEILEGHMMPSRSPAFKHTTQDERVQFHGLSEREKRTDDV